MGTLEAGMSMDVSSSGSPTEGSDSMLEVEGIPEVDGSPEVEGWSPGGLSGSGPGSMSPSPSWFSGSAGPSSSPPLLSLSLLTCKHRKMSRIREL